MNKADVFPTVSPTGEDWQVIKQFQHGGRQLQGLIYVARLELNAIFVPRYCSRGQWHFKSLVAEVGVCGLTWINSQPSIMVIFKEM